MDVGKVVTESMGGGSRVMAALNQLSSSQGNLQSRVSWLMMWGKLILDIVDIVDWNAPNLRGKILRAG